MKESITIIAIDDRDELEKELEIIYEADTLTFRLDGQSIFSGDWITNFRPAIERALELWPA